MAPFRQDSAHVKIQKGVTSKSQKSEDEGLMGLVESFYDKWSFGEPE